MSTLESFNKMLDGFNPLTDERIEEVLNAIDNPLLWVPNDIVIRIPAGDIRAAFNEILLARSAPAARPEQDVMLQALVACERAMREDHPGEDSYWAAHKLADEALALAGAKP